MPNRGLIERNDSYQALDKALPTAELGRVAVACGDHANGRFPSSVPRSGPQETTPNRIRLTKNKPCERSSVVGE